MANVDNSRKNVHTFSKRHSMVWAVGTGKYLKLENQSAEGAGGLIIIRGHKAEESE